MALVISTVKFQLEQRKKKGVAVTENVSIRMRLTFINNRIEYRIDANKTKAEAMARFNMT